MPFVIAPFVLTSCHLCLATMSLPSRYRISYDLTSCRPSLDIMSLASSRRVTYVLTPCHSRSDVTYLTPCIHVSFVLSHYKLNPDVMSLDSCHRSYFASFCLFFFLLHRFECRILFRTVLSVFTFCCIVFVSYPILRVIYLFIFWHRVTCIYVWHYLGGLHKF